MKVTIEFACAVTLMAASCANAADLAVLRNGNSIRHERREIVGAVTRLYLSDSASGYIEIPTDQIERFETDTAPAPVSSNSGSTGSLAPQQSSASGSSAAKVPASDQPILNRASVSRDSLNEMVNGAGARHQIDPDFISSVIRAESGFNNRAVSKKGAQGLMQLMPQTASQLGVANAFDPKANVDGGTKYLRELLEKYNYDVPKALAAYNAGPKRVDQYRGVPPYAETQAYVARIIRDFNRQKIAENPALAKKSKTRSRHSSTTKTQARKSSGTKIAATTTSLPGGQPASR
jgi:hypothetical protein